MSRFNSVPVNIQQMVQTLTDKKVSETEKFNRAQVIRTIKEFCEMSLKEYEKDQMFHRK